MTLTSGPFAIVSPASTIDEKVEPTMSADTIGSSV